MHIMPLQQIKQVNFKIMKDQMSNIIMNTIRIQRTITIQLRKDFDLRNGDKRKTSITNSTPNTRSNITPSVQRDKTK